MKSIFERYFKKKTWKIRNISFPQRLLLQFLKKKTFHIYISFCSLFQSHMLDVVNKLNNYREIWRFPFFFSFYCQIFWEHIEHRCKFRFFFVAYPQNKGKMVKKRRKIVFSEGSCSRNLNHSLRDLQSVARKHIFPFFERHCETNKS